MSHAASELHVQARRSELGVARRYAEDVAEAVGFDADGCYEFVYAVNEAVTNAIRHGASDEDGMIHLSIVADAERLTFTVRDQGTFVVPELDPADTAEHGRGLALMASLVDEVQLQIDPGGTTVRLSKTLPPRNGSTEASNGSSNPRTGSVQQRKGPARVRGG